MKPSKYTTLVIDGNALIELIKAEQEGEDTMGKYDDLVGRGEELIKGGPPSGTFGKIEAKIRASGGSADPAAVAAKVYREKYGAETLARRSAAARKKKKKKDEKSMKKSFDELVNHGEQLLKSGKALCKGMYGGRITEWADQFYGTPIYADALQCLKDRTKCEKDMDAVRASHKDWRELEEMPKSEREATRKKQAQEMQSHYKKREKIDKRMLELEEKLLDHKISEAKAGNPALGKSLSKAVGGEGARGGHVIGHTAKGKPIYAKHDIGHHEEMIAHHKKMARKKGMSKDSRSDHRYAAKQHEEAKGMQERLKVARERGEAGAEKFAQTVHETSRDANFSSAQAHGKSWKEATEVATGGMKEAMKKSMDNKPVTESLPEVQTPPEPSEADQQVERFIDRDDIIAEGLPFSLRSGLSGNEPMSKANDSPGRLLDPVPGASYSSFDLNIIGVGDMNQVDGNGGPDEKKNPGQKYKEPEDVVTTNIPNSPMVFGRSR